MLEDILEILTLEHLGQMSIEQIGASQPDTSIVTEMAILVDRLDSEASETPEIGRNEIEELISQNGTPELV